MRINPYRILYVFQLHVGPQSRTFKIYGIPRINPQLLRQARGPEAGPMSHSLEITTSLKYHNIVISPMYAVDMLAYSDVSDMIGYTKNYHVQPDDC